MTKDFKDHLTEEDGSKSQSSTEMELTDFGSISSSGHPDTFVATPLPAEEDADGSMSPFQGSIQARIAQEVERKRKEGVFPPSFERRLRDSFERLVPQGGGTSREDFRSLFRSTDRAAFMDIDVPIASNRPGVSKLKKIIRSLTAWYLNYLLQQITNFSANLMQLLAAMDLRIKTLENRISPQGAEVGRSIAIPISEKASVYVSGVLSNLPGRSIVTGCCSSNVLTALFTTGADVYGIDTDETLLDQLQQRGLDVRLASTLEELENVRPATLNCVVLQGDYELESISKIRRIIDSAASAVGVGGKIVLITHRPELKLEDRQSKIAIDLAPGHLMHRETWEELLGMVTPKLSLEVNEGNNAFSERIIIANKLSN